MKSFRLALVCLFFCLASERTWSQILEARLDSLEGVCNLYLALDKDIGTRGSYSLTAANISELLSLIRTVKGEDHPQYSYWQLKRADTFYEGDQLARAIPDYENALAKPLNDSTEAEILYRLARCYYLHDQPTELSNCIQRWESVTSKLKKESDEKAVWFLSEGLKMYNALDSIDKSRRAFNQRDSIMQFHPEMSFDRMTCFFDDYDPDGRIPFSVIKDIEQVSIDILVDSGTHCMANLFLATANIYNSSFDKPSYGQDSTLTISLKYLEKAYLAYSSFIKQYPYKVQDETGVHFNFYPNVQRCYRQLLTTAFGLSNIAMDNNAHLLSDNIIDTYILTNASASSLSLRKDFNEVAAFSFYEHEESSLLFGIYENKFLNMLYGNYETVGKMESCLDSMRVTITPNYDYIVSLLPEMKAKDRQRYVSEYRDVILEATEIAGYANMVNINDQEYIKTAFDIAAFFKGILIDYDKFGRLPDNSKVMLDALSLLLDDSILIYFVDYENIICALEYDSARGRYSFRHFQDPDSFDAIWPQEYIGRTVYYIPDGRLTYKNIENYTDSTGKAAHELYNLHRITSVRELILSQNQKQQHNRIESAALFGGISYDNLAFLPGSKNEVQRVSNIIGDKNCRLFTGKTATKNEFLKLSGVDTDVIHIASHAFSAQDSQSFGIYLSGSDFISDLDISRMDLSGTDLVILSACDSADGQISWEGATGLQRAFKLAGVQTIIMALGKVNDTASQFFMERFYDALIKDGDKKNAYYEAITSTRKEFNDDPYYWAPFIMLD